MASEDGGVWTWKLESEHGRAQDRVVQFAIEGNPWDIFSLVPVRRVASNARGQGAQ